MPVLRFIVNKTDATRNPASLDVRETRLATDIPFRYMGFLRNIWLQMALIGTSRSIENPKANADINRKMESEINELFRITISKMPVAKAFKTGPKIANTFLLWALSINAPTTILRIKGATSIALVTPVIKADFVSDIEIQRISTVKREVVKVDIPVSTISKEKFFLV
jgi:hypothetical protein